MNVADTETLLPVDGLTINMDRAGSIAHVMLDRRSARNALSLEMLEGLRRCVEHVSRVSDMSVLVISADGPIFCSGHDLKELSARRSDSDGGRAFFTETMDACASMMQAIVTCRKPVIAAIEGTATAAGCQLVASCDLAYGGEAAQFCTPGVHIGLFCSTPMVALSRNVSNKHAMEMLLTGEMVSAQRAEAIGLINRVVPAGSALEEAKRVAATIASKSSAVVGIGKEAFYRQAEMPLADAYRHASDVMVRNMLHRDAEEGISAFIGKREPVWFVAGREGDDESGG